MRWRAAQGAQVADWLGVHNFKGREASGAARARTRPAASCMAVGGLGKRQGGLSLWHAAGFAERLPPRRYRLAQALGARRCHAARARIRLRSVPLRALSAGQDEPRRARRDASRRRRTPTGAYVASASEALTHGARSGSTRRHRISDPPQLAAAARELAERHRARLPRVGGRGAARGNFPAIHAVGRASAERRG